jgi:predicted nucleotide-binding protein
MSRTVECLQEGNSPADASELPSLASQGLDMNSQPDPTARTLSIIKRQRASLIAIQNSSYDTDLPIWRDRTIRFLNGLIAEHELQLLAGIATDSWAKDKAAYLNLLQEWEAGVQDMPDYYLTSEQLLATAPDQTTPRSQSMGTTPISNNIFIVHGHDSLAKIELARTLEKLKLNPIVLHEQANEGRTIIEKFERDASRVSFAVVILTPDDTGHPKGKPSEARSRARQNVILELGFFSGALGRANVCVLYKGDVEVPSDYLGVVYVSMDDAGAWRFSLAKELKQAGLPIDMNNLL